jgi:hypothetical protein
VDKWWKDKEIDGRMDDGRNEYVDGWVNGWMMDEGWWMGE